MLSVQRLPLSKMIQIHNIGKISKENIELYFEHPKSGGGPVLRCECPVSNYKDCAILEFEDVQGTFILNLLITV
jgi:hypothetical protein